jgi:hypothetical protein
MDDLLDYEEFADALEEEPEVRRSASGQLLSFVPLLPGKDPLIQAITDLGMEQPSHLQHAVLPHMATGRHMVVSDKGGMGKSTAYVLAALAQMEQLGSWSIGVHHVCPSRIREAVLTTLLCAKRPESPLHLLPVALVLTILEQICLDGCYPNAVCNLVLVSNETQIKPVVCEFERLSHQCSMHTAGTMDEVSTVGVRGRRPSISDTPGSAAHVAFTSQGMCPSSSVLASHVIVATPSRALALVLEGHLTLSSLRLLVVEQECLVGRHGSCIYALQRLLGRTDGPPIPESFLPPDKISSVRPPPRFPQFIAVFNSGGRRGLELWGDRAKRILTPSDRDLGYYDGFSDEPKLTWSPAHP